MKEVKQNHFIEYMTHWNRQNASIMTKNMSAVARGWGEEGIYFKGAEGTLRDGGNGGYFD